MFIYDRQCEEAIAVLHNDNEQLERERSALKERLKQSTKNKFVDDLMQKKIRRMQRTSGLLSKDQLILFYFINYSLIQVLQWMDECLHTVNCHCRLPMMKI